MDPISLNISGVQSLVGSKLNKLNTGASNQLEGEAGEREDEFTLKLDDEELLYLAQQWEGNYKGYEGAIKLRQQANKTYYLGKQKEGTYEATNGQPISANLLFEAVETFLPAALAKNPEPVVYCDNTTEGVQVASDVKTMLQYHADILILRHKLSQMVRNWTVDMLGVLKHGWDPVVGDIKLEVRDVKNFIFDPEGYIDVYGDYEGPLGERITVTARKLIDLFPKHKAYITVMVDGKLGTKVTYTEWWNDDYCFYTFKQKVLAKNKNPHYNYDKPAPQLDPNGQPVLDEEGKPAMTEQKGNNHFAKPKKPYTWLSVFSFGDQPHDNTGLIEQNIPNQRRISRRTEQIDYNLSRANNSTVFSENNFDQQTAKQASSGMAKGHPILVPQGGPIADAIHQLPAQGISDSYFKDQESSETTLRSIFGTQGISSQQPNEDTTARGMILNQQFDNTRIGGGIGSRIEQVADNVFNWQVQLYHVYYDTPHFASVIGQMKAIEFITLTSENLNRHLVVSVSPDSLKAHDELTEMNQAMSLFEAGALDIKTLLTMQNVPDVNKVAESTVLWLIDKQAYLQINFPEIAQQLQQIQQQNAMAQGAAQAQGAQSVGDGQEPASPPESLSVPSAGASLSSVPIPK